MADRSDRHLAPLDTLSPLDVLSRRGRVAWHTARRLVRWTTARAEFPRPSYHLDSRPFPHLWYERLVPIGRSDADADPRLEAGKRHNVALAAALFDGVVFSAHRPLSFWRTLGPATERRGFVSGMELRGGCILPAIGGGLCLISNALFRAAVESGFAILERHGHTAEAVPPGPDDVWGLDATVYYPYVDLRIAPTAGEARLTLRVAEEFLHLRIHGHSPLESRVTLRAEPLGVVAREEGRFIGGRVWRVIERPGAVALEEKVVEDWKRLVGSDARRRHCGTCGKDDCASRVSVVAAPASRLGPIRG